MLSTSLKRFNFRHETRHLFYRSCHFKHTFIINSNLVKAREEQSKSIKVITDRGQPRHSQAHQSIISVSNVLLWVCNSDHHIEPAVTVVRVALWAARYHLYTLFQNLSFNSQDNNPCVYWIKIKTVNSVKSKNEFVFFLIFNKFHLSVKSFFRFTLLSFVR